MNALDTLAAKMSGKKLTNKLNGQVLEVARATRAENTLILVFGEGSAMQTMSYTGAPATVERYIGIDWVVS